MLVAEVVTMRMEKVEVVMVSVVVGMVGLMVVGAVTVVAMPTAMVGQPRSKTWTTS